MKEKNAAPQRARPRRVWRVLSAVLALLLLAAAFAAGWLVCGYRIDPRLKRLGWMIDTLEENYYHAVDTDALYDELYDAVVPDAFSHLYSEEEYDALVAEGEGNNAGVGISLVSDADGARFFRVTENSPACLAGIRAGMYLLGWGTEGGSPVTGSASELIGFVKTQTQPFYIYAAWDAGAALSEENAYRVQARAYKAAYCVYRDGTGTFAFRGEEKAVLQDVTQTAGALTSLADDTAYIRLDAFDGNCAAEFKECLSLMKSRGKTHLILDLRGNGGGYMDDLRAIAAHLLRDASEKRPVVARAVFRSGDAVEYRASGNDFAAYFGKNGKVTVLADENSASASECLIGALVDYGTIAFSDIYLRRAEDGVCRTYGKGVMQSTFPAPDGGAFRLTVAEIVWPQGKSIHGVGVTPADGAVPVDAPALAGEEDVFLEQVIAALGA